MKTIKPTEAQALEVLSRIQKKYGYDDSDSMNGPQLIMDFDWLGYGEWPAIVWEGGPYEWSVTDSFKLLDGSPKGMWYEAITSWSLGIFVETADWY
jgi:hypothetical protein